MPADDKGRRDKSGRVTPPKNGRGRTEPAGGEKHQPRRSIAPKRIGPFEKPDSSAPLGQVGRRPTRPGVLFTYAAVYFICGVLSFFVLGTGTLGVIVGVVLIGISLLWLRGGSTALLRQQRERDGG